MATMTTRQAVEGNSLPSRVRFVRSILLVIMLLDAAYLFIANRASSPPRIPIQAFTYEASLLAHIVLGAGMTILLALQTAAVVRSIRQQSGARAVIGAGALLSLFVCLASGFVFLGIGAAWIPLTARPALRLTHDVSTVALLLLGVAWLLLRARSGDSSASRGKQTSNVLRLLLLIAVPYGALLAYTLYAPNTDRVIVNPALPPMVPDDEGDGKAGKFFPASAQSVDGQFFPSAYFMDSKSCGQTGCHPDIYKQWNSSAHHLSSFNNQWYRKAVEYTQEVVGTQPSKWCGGCHDMAVLLTEDPKKPGHSRFDTPIAEHDYPEQKFPESHAGIGCAVCHSIVHVKSTMGNSDYLADYPPMHKYLDTNNPVMHGVHTFLTRLAPEPHKKTFLRPFHKDQTAKFCSSCHKVHLDIPVNGFRWLRGQNTYDEWQQSGVSGFGAASFYYPMDEKTSQPAFKKCADCHMPKTPSKDAGNIDGIVHDHRFPAANTALPEVYHDKEQAEVTRKFLQDKALSIDIFALRRTQGEAAPAAESSPGRKAPAGDVPKAGSVMGDTSEASVPGAAANAPYKEESVTAPLNRGGEGAVLVRGERPLVDVVVRTLKLGHAFPAGTVDAFDIWVELEAKDSNGRTFYHSGSLQWPNGPVEEGAERYRALTVDEHSNPINKRNVFAQRALVYAKLIPPGAADTIHFRIPIPKDCGDKVTLTAKLNHRKFTWFNNIFSYAGQTEAMKAAIAKPGEFQAPAAVGYDGAGKKRTGPVSHGWDERPMRFDADLTTVSGPLKDIPVLPITVLAQNEIVLPVVNSGDRTAPPVVALTPDDVKKDRVRWNDYGIGLLLQGDFRNATRAFERVTKLAPKWPEGYVNIGRVRQAERDSKAAKAALEKAFQLYDAAPTPMTRYQKGRAQNFYAQALFDQGRLEESLSVLAQVREVFPEDRNVRNLTGTILFRSGRYDEAIEQFKKTLSIDAEDITAHYNLMKCYFAKGDQASQQSAITHRKLYLRFKADETTTNLIGPYLQAHPADNNLASRIHEHGDAIVSPVPEWYRALQKRQASRKAPQWRAEKPHRQEKDLAAR